MAILMIGILFAAFVFCIVQFCDLMRRRDDEFPGRYDKAIWAVAIIFTNVVGAFAYWLMKPLPVTSRESDSSRSQWAADLQKYSSTPYEPH